MTEIPLSQQDLADLDSLGVDGAPPQRTLLSVWNEVLSNIDEVASQAIPAPIAAKVVASWPFLTFQETAAYHRIYHEILGTQRDLLTEIIKENPDALGWTGEEDGRENHMLYRELLVRWHLTLDGLEQDWRAEAPDSQVWIAAIADARAFFFSQMGLAGHLDAIGFTLTDGEFMAAVTEVREEQGE